MDRLLQEEMSPKYFDVRDNVLRLAQAAKFYDSHTLSQDDKIHSDPSKWQFKKSRHLKELSSAEFVTNLCNDDSWSREMARGLNHRRKAFPQMPVLISPLAHAVRSGMVECVSILVANGADPFVQGVVYRIDLDDDQNFTSKVSLWSRLHSFHLCSTQICFIRQIEATPYHIALAARAQEEHRRRASTTREREESDIRKSSAQQMLNIMLEHDSAPVYRNKLGCWRMLPPAICYGTFLLLFSWIASIMCVSRQSLDLHQFYDGMIRGQVFTEDDSLELKAFEDLENHNDLVAWLQTEVLC